ncbi:PIN domain-containing protein [Endothiovibrio diazotrophicus]
MNLVDSCGWLEYLADGPNADFFAPALEDTEQLIVPTIVIHEVHKRLLRQRGEDAALQATALMRQGHTIPLDERTALEAAALGIRHRLPLADSIVYASGRLHGATIWTQDADFEGLDDVRYQPKRK